MGYAEKEKSQASDSFKRACFNWGIGRELYTAPFIWIPVGKATIQMKESEDKKKRYFCNDRFFVDSIAYNSDREISGLVVKNDKGQTVYELKAGKSTGQDKDKEKEQAQTKEKKKKDVLEDNLTREQMASLQAELERTGVAMEAMQERYQIQAPETMNKDTYKKVMAALAKTKSAKVA